MKNIQFEIIRKYVIITGIAFLLIVGAKFAPPSNNPLFTFFSFLGYLNLIIFPVIFIITILLTFRLLTYSIKGIVNYQKTKLVHKNNLLLIFSIVGIIEVLIIIIPIVHFFYGCYTGQAC